MIIRENRKRATDKKIWADVWKRIRLLDHWKLPQIQEKMANLMKKHLPKDKSIIEAGCGLSQWIGYLYSEGFNIIGIDFSEDTIKKVKRTIPSLPIYIGNVEQLDYADESFDGYISLGVVEHFISGPMLILREANRILEKKGVLFLSVPYINPLRRYTKHWKANFNSGNFYQYYFDKKAICSFIGRAGFTVEETIPWNAFQGLKTSQIFSITKLLKKIGNKKNIGIKNDEKITDKVIEKISFSTRFINKFISFPLNEYIFGHMIIIVAVKN